MRAKRSFIMTTDGGALGVFVVAENRRLYQRRWDVAHRRPLDDDWRDVGDFDALDERARAQRNQE